MQYLYIVSDFQKGIVLFEGSVASPTYFSDAKVA
jgi:hypothetical protein